VEEEPLTVRKRDGSSEPFERPKLLESIRIACAKRPVSRSDVEALVDEVESTLEAADEREVDSLRIGELVMMRLRSLDQVAFVRFASVYRNFQDTTEFMEEIRELVRRAGYEAAGQVDMFQGDEGDDEE